MPRQRTTRSPSNGTSRRTNGAVATISTYAHDPRWETPTARRRTDVFVVERARSTPAAPFAAGDDPLLLTA